MIILDNDDSTRNKLDPWRVIVAQVFGLDSYKIPTIIDKAGMTVNWELAERQDYSDKYRKDAYRPRINSAYEALDRENKLRVVSIVSRELGHLGLTEQLNDSLHKIGWNLDGQTLVPASEPVRELFFPQGTQHDAYVHIKEIMGHTKHTVRIIDPYLDGTIFAILGDIMAPLRVELLTRNLPNDFAHETNKFKKQYPTVKIETRRSQDFHDRFIVIDDRECWHIGCSIKDAGNKGFMLSRIEDHRNAEALMKSLITSWDNGEQVT